MQEIDSDLNLLPEQAEMYILGSIAMEPSLLLQVQTDLLPEHFGKIEHRWIYEAMLEIDKRGEIIDLLLIQDRLRAEDRLKKGMAGYLVRLIEDSPVISRMKTYVKIVLDESQRRKFGDMISFMSDLYTKKDIPIDTKFTVVSKLISDAIGKGARNDIKAMRQLVEERTVEDDRLSALGSGFSGIPTGFKTLDGILGGFNNSDLIIIGARPAIGKTALALEMARYAAVDQNKKVLFFTLEMSGGQLTQRGLSLQSGIPLEDIIQRKVQQKDIENLAYSIKLLKTHHLKVDETAGNHIAQIRAKCNLAKKVDGLDIVFVDYLQLITGSKTENRTQEVSEISRQLKIIAKELNIPVIALSQLSRGIEGRSDKKPMLSDLRESGSIEQDADIVMFLSREDYDGKTDRDKGLRAELSIAKHRNGVVGKIPLRFQSWLTRYVED